jgi:hypothetical protein
MPIRDEGCDLRLSDIESFIRVYEQSLTVKADSFNKLFASLSDQPVTTTIGRMERVTAFLHEDPLKPRTRRKGQGPGFSDLFVHHPREGLQPTAAAKKLYDRFLELRELSNGAPAEFRKLIVKEDGGRKTVRLGIPETIGEQWLAHACSGWEQAFHNQFDLAIELNNSLELIRELGVGQLDLAIAYGNRNDSDPPTEEQMPRLLERPHPVCFRSFGYSLETVLLAHPNATIWTRSRNRQDDPNLQGAYWRDVEIGPFQTLQSKEMRSLIEEAIKTTDEQSVLSGSTKKGGKRQTDATSSPVTRLRQMRKECYSKLRRINLRDIDFDWTPLIVVPSYAESPALRQIVEDSRSLFGVREVKSYHEAITMVRCSQGVAISTESFWTRGHITVFRLASPHYSATEITEKASLTDPYTRWVGVYYNTKEGLDANACQVTAFLLSYLKRFETFLRVGRSPSSGDPIYDEWVKQWAKTLDDEGIEKANWLHPTAFPKFDPNPRSYRRDPWERGTMPEPNDER